MNAFFWFLLIVFISWMVFLYIFPFFARIYLQKLSRKFTSRSQEAHHKENNPEGTINIDYIPEEQQDKTDLPGDYVDFEEIKDK